MDQDQIPPRGDQMASSQTPSYIDENKFRSQISSFPKHITERRMRKVTETLREDPSDDTKTHRFFSRNSRDRRSRHDRNTHTRTQSKTQTEREKRKQPAKSGSNKKEFLMMTVDLYRPDESLGENNIPHGEISGQEESHLEDVNTLKSELDIVKSGTRKSLTNVEQELTQERRDLKTSHKISIEKTTCKNIIQLQNNLDSNDEQKAEKGLEKCSVIGENSKTKSIINQGFINNTDLAVYHLRGEGDGKQNPTGDTVDDTQEEELGAVGGHPDTTGLVSDEASAVVTSKLLQQDFIDEDRSVSREQEPRHTVPCRDDRGEARRRQHQYATTERNLRAAQAVFSPASSQRTPQDLATHSTRARQTCCRHLGRPCPASRGVPPRPANLLPVEATAALPQSASLANCGTHIRGQNTSVEELPDSLHTDTPVPCQGEDVVQIAHGHNLQMQYGGDVAVDGHDPGARAANRWLCRICGEQLFRGGSQAALLFYCQHLVVCEACVVHVRVCPVCEEVLRHFIRVRL